MSSFGYFIREAFIGFKRNLSTSLGSVITVFLSMLIVGLFLFGGMIINNVVNSVESEVSITAYVADETDAADISTLESYIQGLEGVANVSFTTKDEALERFRKSMTSNPEIIDQLDGQNPLPASIDVELSDPQSVVEVANAIESNATFRKICDNPDDPSDSLKYGQKTVEQLFSLTNYVRYIGIAVIALLVFIALVFTNNTIRLAILARSEEISIMRLVGASNGFIRGPFLMEGAIEGLFGSLLAVAGLELVRQFALPQVKGALAWLPIDLSMNSVLIVYAILLVAGLLIGLIGSAIAMRRYLKV